VYGPVRTVVWQGSVGDCRPYADQVGLSDKWSRHTMLHTSLHSLISPLPFVYNETADSLTRDINFYEMLTGPVRGQEAVRSRARYR
jgi:hypothetical protein